MKINKIKFFVIAVLLGSCFFVHAQKEDDRLNREMTLEREYDPIVQDANKVTRLPDITDPVVTKRSIEYSTFTLPGDPEKELVVLPSGEIMTAIPFNKRKGYFNFGGGMYMNLNGDAGYHILNDHRNKLNIFLSHRSTNGKLKYLQWDEKQKAAFNDNLGGVDFAHHFEKNATFHLGGRYGFSSFNYYGLPLGNYSPALSTWEPDSLVDRETNQVNQVIKVYTGIHSNGKAKIDYKVDLEYVRFAQKYGWAKEVDGVRENIITALLGLSTKINNGNQSVGVSGKMDYFDYSYPAFEEENKAGYHNNLEATITPYYQALGDNWRIKLGANIMMITGDSGKFFASPHISGELTIANRTALYADLGGEIRSNDPYSLSRHNRYLNHAYSVEPSRTWLDGVVGVRSGAVSDLWFELFAGYKITDDEVFYIPSTEKYGKDRFGSYYGVLQSDASLLKFGGSLKYMYQKWADFSIKGVYNSWTLKEEGMSAEMKDPKPYGKPAIEISADLTVRPLKPLSLSLGYYLGANRYTWLAGQEVKMNNINDLNFTGTWNFNNTFGAYVKLNNLLFQEQELLYGYPMQSFNAMAGININF